MTDLDLRRIRATFPMMSLSALLLLSHLNNVEQVDDYSECARELHFPSNTLVCRSAIYLAEKGLITSDPYPGDKRRVVLRITELGRQVLAFKHPTGKS